MINKLGLHEEKFDIKDKSGGVRSRVYQQKSVTKAAIKEEIIHEALMETIKNEKKVNQLLEKIDSKRPINERYYLKRTKGNQA
jgi:HEAT repeat protein